MKPIEFNKPQELQIIAANSKSKLVQV